MSHRFWGSGCACLVLAVGAALGGFQDEEAAVEPSELARRDELVGKKVVVDDHVKYFVKRPGKEPDELQLRRTNVTFLVPGKLTWESKPTAALVHGVLRRDGARLVCDVTEVKPMAGDLERLENGVKGLSARDAETRQAWARWASKRAREFKDEALLKRAREVEAEAFRIETAMKRLGVDAPSEWLAMAKDARRRRVPEPEPAALASTVRCGRSSRRRRRLPSSRRRFTRSRSSFRRPRTNPGRRERTSRGGTSCTRRSQPRRIATRPRTPERPSTAGCGPMPTNG